MRNHDPLLLRCERENLLVGEPVEGLVPVEREYIMARSRKPSPYVPARDVRVEQDAHALLVRVGERESRERIELAPLREGPAVVGDLFVDLLRVAGVVGLGQFDRARLPRNLFRPTGGNCLALVRTRRENAPGLTDRRRGDAFGTNESIEKAPFPRLFP